jgi:aminoglycoside 3-N-acetyltransferase
MARVRSRARLAAPPRMHTRQSIGADLAALGLAAADTVLVHSSLRSLGWMCGGPIPVVQALLDVVGPAGTIVVPAQTVQNSDPARWGAVTGTVVPDAWWSAIREHLPPFDPAVTPSAGMGVIAESVRTWPGAQRSAHPQTSFAALGARAEQVLAGHELTCQLGDRSPLARLEQVDAKVLLLGVGFAVCTAFHLAEYRLPDPPLRDYSCAVSGPTGRQWITYTDVALIDYDFPQLGAAFESSGAVTVGRVGDAASRLFPLRAATDYAGRWMAEHRTSRRSRKPTG